MLLIDADPMMLVNDPKLTLLIETLTNSGLASQGMLGKGKNATKDVIEFIGVIVIKLCEIIIDILL